GIIKEQGHRSPTKRHHPQASQYSDMVHMSKQGIYDRLVSEYGGDIHLRGSAVRHRTLPERHPVNMSKLGKWSD
ncbi:Ltp family lipoprotein, partial [uncultured Bifidobacterium sp.]|uniref:Ltp family lipoprotein n=1 Tax=uncultured Bifidobacterium sp. TaxID=165187 RepID=UPI0025974EEB